MAAVDSVEVEEENAGAVSPKIEGVEVPDVAKVDDDTVDEIEVAEGAANAEIANEAAEEVADEATADAEDTAAQVGDAKTEDDGTQDVFALGGEATASESSYSSFIFAHLQSRDDFSQTNQGDRFRIIPGTQQDTASTEVNVDPST